MCRVIAQQVDVLGLLCYNKFLNNAIGANYADNEQTTSTNRRNS